MPSAEFALLRNHFYRCVNVVGDGRPAISQTKAYADAEDAEFQLGADLEERGGMARCGTKLRYWSCRGGTCCWVVAVTLHALDAFLSASIVARTSLTSQKKKNT